MKLIDQSYEILDQKGYKLEDIYKHIELCARTCYKSEDKITEDSAEKFVKRMIDNKHTAMLEHGAVYLYIPGETMYYNLDLCFKYQYNKYSRCISRDAKTGNDVYITTNMRVIVENGWEDDLQYLCEPTKYHIKRRTVKLITNIHVYKDLTRHRTMSFAIESTRFCNYSKDKFSSELTFIKPTWVGNYGENMNNEDFIFYKYLCNLEQSYLKLVNSGWQAQQAAAILPQCTKADVIMTGFEDDWDYVFRLRTSIIAETGQPHPQVAELMDKIYEEFKVLKNADR